MQCSRNVVDMLVQNAAAMWVTDRIAKSMQNMVPILAQYGGCIVQSMQYGCFTVQDTRCFCYVKA